MELLEHLALGFSTAASWANVFYCLLGVMLGTAIGVLPGLGSGGDHRDAAADHVRAAAGHRADHAGRNLLRLHSTAARPRRSS